MKMVNYAHGSKKGGSNDRMLTHWMAAIKVGRRMVVEK